MAMMGYSTCNSCNGVFQQGYAHFGLHPGPAKYALAFCVNCAPRFWRAKNWILVKQPVGKIHRAIKCITCPTVFFAGMLNIGLSDVNAALFCIRCATRMMNQHQWDVFQRVARDEDLPGYAPRKISFGTGFEAKERTGVIR